MVNLASIKESRGNVGKAEALFRQARETDRDTCVPPSQYGFYLLRSDRTEDAQKAFEEALKRDATCANAYFGPGSIAMKKGDTAHALADFKETVHYNPEDLAAHLEAANILIAQNNESEMVQVNGETFWPLHGSDRPGLRS